MNDPQQRIISVTTTLAAVLALIIVLSFPVGYFVVEYHSLNRVLEARAETKAIYATQLIFANPDLWQFETVRLEHFLSDHGGSGEPEEQRIIDLKGQVVAQTPGHLPRPIHTVSRPLYDSGRVVGYLEISRSLRPLLNYSLFLGALSLLLGAAVYVTLKFYPLRAFSQTLALLNQERQRFRVIFQSNLMAVAVLNRDCTILDANATFSYLTFMRPEELRGRNFLDLVSLEPGGDLGTLFRDLLEGHRESFHLEMCYRSRDGASKWGDLSVFALREGTSEGISCFVMFNDITEKKQAEDEVERQRDQLRALAARLAKIQEIERQQLAQDLHDQICQNLAAIDLTLESLKIRAKQETMEQLLSRLSDASALVEQAGEVARDIMEGLRPTVLEHYGLMGALRRLRGQFAQRTGIRLEIQEKAAVPQLAPAVELAFFRIAQEALANVSKHAKAKRVTLTLDAEAGLVRLIIADDGIGFDQNEVGQSRGRYGWGLMTMAERAIAVGGDCRVESLPGQGTRVIAEVPLGVSVVSAQPDGAAKPE